MKLLLLIITLFLLSPLGFSPVLAASEQLISQQEVTQVLIDYLADESDRLPGVELRLTSSRLPQPFKVPAGHVEHQVIPAKPGVVGSRRVTLMTRVDGQIAANQSIRVEIEALAEILVAADNLRRGEILTEDKVSYQQQDISQLKQPLFVGDEIFGKRLKRTVRLGQPILYKQIEFPPLIKRGDRVTIRATRGGLTLTAAGEAKQDGLADETIRVMNINSHKEVLCRVAASGLVTVEF